MLIRLSAAIMIIVFTGLLIFKLTSAKPVKISVNEISRMLKVDPQKVDSLANNLPVEPTAAETKEHFHIATRFIVNGVTLYPSRNVGQSAINTYYAIHTHDSSGVVHIHSPVKGRKFTSLDLWHAFGLDGKFNSLEHCIYKNNHPVNSEFILADNQDIQVEFKKCSSTAPLEKFNFSDAPIRSKDYV